jgi:hypothetical protein
MANTNILIKRSSILGKPGSLLAGELAYSYASNTIFIGTPNGNGVVNVGGQYYTSQIDTATDAATGFTLVKRDASGNASFNFITANIIGTIQGTANAAAQLENSRNFSIDGGDITASAISFNGTGDVVLNASLDTVPSLGAGTYGSTTSIPIIQVAANGRVMNVTTAAISTSFNIYGDSGVTAVAGGDSLTLAGGDGITSVAGVGPNVTFDVDNTVVRSNTPATLQTIDGSLEISGNLTVLGTQTVINTETLNVADPIILLAANNTTADDVDIGFSGTYYANGNIRHTGLFRNAGTSEYYVFDNYDKDLTGNNEIDVADSSFRTANVNAGYVKGNLIATTTTTVTANVTGDLTVDGTIYSANIIPIANATYSLGSSSARFKDLWLSGQTINLDGSTISSGAGILTLTNENGATLEISGATGSAILSTNSLSLTNALTVPNGGTGANTFSAGQILIGDGTNALKSLANSSYTQTGTLATSNTISSITVDAYGRLTASTSEKIQIDANQIVSGVLGYSRGGTGSTSYTTGALVIAGASGLESLSNTTYTATGSGAANNTVSSLTVDVYGRVTAATFSAISGLTVPQGGTGRSTFTTNGIIYGNSTDGQLVTAAAGTSDQTFSNQILTVTNAGVPVWSTALDGGTF